MAYKKPDGRSGKPPTEKQKHFAREFIANGGNATEAFRQAYTDKHDAKTTQRMAFKVKQSAAIAAEIDRLQKKIDQKFMITIGKITQELDENRTLAKELGKPEAMNAATMGKAKLHGLITDKRETKHGFAEEFVDALLGNLPDTTGLPGQHRQLPEDSDDEVLH